MMRISATPSGVGSSSALKHPLVVSSAVTLSYLLLYTGYDKSTKQLKPSNLSALVTQSKGVTWTLVELNKAISLSGMTGMLISFLPQFSECKSELLFYSMNMLWVHSAYSMYKFYGYSLKRLVNEKWIKQLSIAFGAAGQLALSAGYWGYISKTALATSATILSVAHFWTMEVDYKYVLQVRPYAYLPFPLAGAVLAYLGYFAVKPDAT
jgi:hypothetical protein